MSITADLIRGHTETIILAQLMGQDSYGYNINNRIKESTGNKFELKEATLYTAFRRLEETGCITSYWGDTGVGARRRYYSITENGKSTYARLIDEWAAANEIISKLIKPSGTISEAI